MKLSDEQNLEFMNNKDRLEAQNELDEAIKNVKEIQTLSAQTILTLMPQALKKLARAYDNLNIVETRVESEIIEKQNA